MPEGQTLHRLADEQQELRAEALHAVGLHPSVPASSLSDACVAQLWATLVTQMTDAVARGTIAPHPSPGGRAVYRQDRCADCGTAVDVSPVGGRAAYACPRCQPPPLAAAGGG